MSLPVPTAEDVNRAPPTLADLPTLRRGRVLSVAGDDATAHRLLVLGFAPGTLVEFARRAPFHGPIIVDVRGAQICLRVKEARRVLVAPLGDGS